MANLFGLSSLSLNRENVRITVLPVDGVFVHFSKPFLHKIFEEVLCVLIATSAKILFHQYAFGFPLNRTRIVGFVGGRSPFELVGPSNEVSFCTSNFSFQKLFLINKVYIFICLFSKNGHFIHYLVLNEFMFSLIYFNFQKISKLFYL